MYFEIEGDIPLEGEIAISGSKNAALPIIAASLLCEEGTVHLQNIPNISDVLSTQELLNYIGIKTEYSNNVLHLDINNSITIEIPYEITKKTRSSILFLGSVLAKSKQVILGLPEGDQIGDRPIDIHLYGLEKMGVKTSRNKNQIICSLKKKLKGEYIYLDYPSSTGTELLMIAASLAEGVTVLDNVETKPEVVDLGNFLKKIGVSINGLGTSRITIKSKKAYALNNYRIIPDPLEAGTYMAYTGITKGNVKLNNIKHEHIRPIIYKMREMGYEIDPYKNSLRISCDIERPKCNNIVATKPFPGFPSDLQPIFASLLCTASGTSTIKDLVFTERFQYVKGLRNFGAKIHDQKNSITIQGKSELTPCSVLSEDIRAGACFIGASLACEGTSTVYGVEHILRGYENIDQKLRQLGANISLKS
jgi:UDP-N-acetylglucosamine 1-carboxyvinyltransferase